LPSGKEASWPDVSSNPSELDPASRRCPAAAGPAPAPAKPSTEC
jgi:hypothetical protein